MKFTRKLFLLTTIFLLSFSNSVKITSQGKLKNLESGKLEKTNRGQNLYRKTDLPIGTSTSTNSANSSTDSSKSVPVPNPIIEIEPSYKKLVTNMNKPRCPVVLDPKNENRDNTQNSFESFPQQGPFVRPNPFKIMNTPDRQFINYVFDYLQEMEIPDTNKIKLNVWIANEFNKAFEDAKKMDTKDLRFFNPYQPANLLFYFSKGAAGDRPFSDDRLIDVKINNNNDNHIPKIDLNTKLTPEQEKIRLEEIYKTIKSYNSKFDKETFEMGITPIQVYHVMRNWRWGSPGQDRDILDIKKIVDTYDFDGDGNLNKLEFVIFQIHSVVKVGHQCLNHCLNNVIDLILEPLFMYLDCDNDGYINSDNLWEGLKFVNRGDSKKYDMYKCQLPVELNKGYRTNSVNDLILKATKAADGFLTKKEFVEAILTGFWERTCEPLSIFAGNNGETVKGLEARWERNGEDDKECNDIMKYFKI